MGNPIPKLHTTRPAPFPVLFGLLSACSIGPLVFGRSATAIEGWIEDVPNDRTNVECGSLVGLGEFACDTLGDGFAYSLARQEVDWLEFSLLQTSLHINRRSRQLAQRTHPVLLASPNASTFTTDVVAPSSSLMPLPSTRPTNAWKPLFQASRPSTTSRQIGTLKPELTDSSSETFQMQFPSTAAISHNFEGSPRIAIAGKASPLSEGSVWELPLSRYVGSKLTFSFLTTGWGIKASGGEDATLQHFPRMSVVTDFVGVGSANVFRTVAMLTMFGLAFGLILFMQIIGLKLGTGNKEDANVGTSKHLRQDQFLVPGLMPPTPLSREHWRRPRAAGSSAKENSGNFSSAKLILRVEAVKPTSDDPHAHEQPNTPTGDVLCQALSPGKEAAQAHFVVPVETLRKMMSGHGPLEILGPAQKPLLYARLPTTTSAAISKLDVGIGAGVHSSNQWLELATTARSRHPHACVGPFVLGSVSKEALQIRGPRNERYGSLVPVTHGSWQAQHNGRVILTLMVARPPDLGSSRLELASPQTTTVRSSGFSADLSAGDFPEGAVAKLALGGYSGQVLEIKTTARVDALLTLLCSLVVLLMSPELLRYPEIDGAPT